MNGINSRLWMLALAMVCGCAMTPEDLKSDSREISQLTAQQVADSDRELTAEIATCGDHFDEARKERMRLLKRLEGNYPRLYRSLPHSPKF